METILAKGEFPGFQVEHARRDHKYLITIGHIHGYHELYYLVDGERFFFIQNRVYQMRPGDLVLINANQIHRMGPAEFSPHERILFRISTGVLEKLANFLDNPAITQFFSTHAGVMRLPPESREFLEESLYAIIDEFTLCKPEYTSFVWSHLATLFAFLCREHPEQYKAPNRDFTPPKLQKVHEIAEYINRNFQDDMTLDSLSKQFYVRKYYLCLIFKDITGFTVNDYIHANRICKARELLQHTKDCITKVAQDVGYSSDTQFGKKFKEATGLSPLQYRKGSANERDVIMPSIRLQ